MFTAMRRDGLDTISENGFTCGGCVLFCDTSSKMDLADPCLGSCLRTKKQGNKFSMLEVSELQRVQELTLL